MLFVSYSRAELATVQPFVDALESVGIRCWLDHANIPVGEVFVARLGEALRAASNFALIDTLRSRSSYWVRREKRAATRLRAAGVYQALFRVAAADLRAEPPANEFTEVGDLSTAVEHLSQIALVATDGSQEALHPIQIEGAIPTDLAGWVGRHHELQTLDDWWDSTGGSAWIVGAGGMGKSAILETWLAALRDIGYEKLANVHVRFVRARETRTGDVEKLVSGIKSATNDVKLVVIDGFDESDARDQLERLLQEAIFGGARVLVSSRLSPSARIDATTTVVDLREMNQNDCIQYLEHLGLKHSEAAVLGRTVQYHPLAARIVANLVVKHSYSVPDVLSDLSRNSLEHTGSIESAVRLGLERLSLHARTVLQQVCARDPAGTEMDLDDAADSLRTSINELVQAGLIQAMVADSTASLTVHPLVRQIVTAA